MKMNNLGLMALVSHEGIVTAPYRDSKGIWTIGIGHTAYAGAPDPATFVGDMTVGECFDLFRKDVAKYEADVTRAVKVPLQQHEFDALVSFHYNTGAIFKASLVKHLNAGDWVRAVNGFMLWSKPEEIIPRRKAECQLFAAGKYPSPFANVYPAKNGNVLWGSAVKIDLRSKIDGDTVEKPASKPKPVPAPDTAPKAQPTPAGKQGGLMGLVIAIIVAAATAAAGFFLR